ncbi:hypothetical protein LCGC14_2509820 [marine sediment metagenome]|uniref:SOWAHA-C winged helix-turn-helix domain-containing protein n=1 Tax=marine sediment metagenome TaxID=412755 RepID=A0A0F9AZF8_9ZZZZ
MQRSLTMRTRRAKMLRQTKRDYRPWMMSPLENSVRRKPGGGGRPASSIATDAPDSDPPTDSSSSSSSSSGGGGGGDDDDDGAAADEEQDSEAEGMDFDGGAVDDDEEHVIEGDDDNEETGDSKPVYEARACTLTASGKVNSARALVCPSLAAHDGAGDQVTDAQNEEPNTGAGEADRLGVRVVLFFVVVVRRRGGRERRRRPPASSQAGAATGDARACAHTPPADAQQKTVGADDGVQEHEVRKALLLSGRIQAKRLVRHFRSRLGSADAKAQFVQSLKKLARINMEDGEKFLVLRDEYRAGIARDQ